MSFKNLQYVEKETSRAFMVLGCFLFALFIVSAITAGIYMRRVAEQDRIIELLLKEEEACRNKLEGRKGLVLWVVRKN